MSWRALAWATRRTTGSTTAKLVLLVLAEAADQTGFTFVGQAEIARRAELSRRAVVSQMARLEAAGLIRRARRTRACGQRTSDSIWLQMDAAPQGEPAARETGRKVNAAHPGRGGQSEPGASQGEPDDASRCAGFTRTLSEPPVEPPEPARAPGATPSPVLGAPGDLAVEHAHQRPGFQDVGFRNGHQVG